MGPRLAGVDGCRVGWVVASDAGIEVVPALEDVIPRFDAIGIDIPIGLPESGPRTCDVEARRRLGPRRSSVFPAPRRSLLACRDWAAASGVSRQAFNLLPKIVEVDALLSSPMQDRVLEVHPELAFAALNAGAPMAHPKRTALGRAERLVALGLDDAPRVRGAAPDDVLDALAVLASMRRWAEGRAERLGDGAVDARGLRMEIWF
jgi:predicted RNase H-like nuclease